MLTRWNTVSEMLRSFPESWESYSRNEAQFMTPDSDIERWGPHMLMFLVERVLYRDLLLPAVQRDPLGAETISLFDRVNQFCDEMLASDDFQVQAAADTGIVQALALGGEIDSEYVLRRIKGPSRKNVIFQRRAHGKVVPEE
jgi:hypothetical protein